jgi:hypothetical protein
MANRKLLFPLCSYHIHRESSWETGKDSFPHVPVHRAGTSLEETGSEAKNRKNQDHAPKRRFPPARRPIESRLAARNQVKRFS